MTAPVALVTGGNRGIGLATCRALAERGCTVLMGARDPVQAVAAASDMAKDGLHIRVLPLDVTDDDSVAEAVRLLRNDVGRLDILVNNAGVLFELDLARDAAAPGEPFLKPSEVSMARVRDTFAVNVLGAIAITSAALPLLRAAPRGRLIAVSSRLGSIAYAAAIAGSAEVPSPLEIETEYLTLLAYNSSKAALNAAMLQYMIELRGSTVSVDVVDPGHCATDINGRSGDRSPAEAGRLVADIALSTEPGSPRFWNEHGQLPW